VEVQHLGLVNRSGRFTKQPRTGFAASGGAASGFGQPIRPVHQGTPG
jgi:hypothetical protein